LACDFLQQSLSKLKRFSAQVWTVNAKNKLWNSEGKTFIFVRLHLHCDIVLPKWYPAEWIVGLLYKRLQEEFFGKLPNDNIVEANLTAHIRRIVDWFVATGSVEKGKSVGRPSVNDEIVEDSRQRMEQSSKKKPQKVITSGWCTTLHLSENC
jgi:hypothetical protein